MKKDRNSFFSQYGVSSYNTDPYMNQGMMPYPNNNFNTFEPIPTNNNTYDIESRLAKIERDIKLIESRLSKLESVATQQAQTDYNFANSMYMV